MYPVKLIGKKVVLREFRFNDEDAVFAIVSDDRVTRWLSYNSRTHDETRAMLAGAIERAKLEPRTEYYLPITLPHDDRAIGFARIGLDGIQAGKLGYAVHADRQGHGYGTDAARTMVNFGFRDLGLHRISVAVGPENESSIAVARRLGFQYEGRIRDHVYTNNAWRDSLLYSLLANEWHALKANSE